MTDKKPDRGGPRIEVIRRPSTGPSTPGGSRPRRRAPSNLPPPSPQQIAALAKKERVPARIAKGELIGNMKCRIWKKLHQEEARRFDQAYTLLEKHPELELADAFGVVQSGMSVEDFMARKARSQKKVQVKAARSEVSAEPTNAFIDELIASGEEVALSLAERTVLDIIKSVGPVSFQLERSGRMEKLKVVLLGRRSVWEALSASFTREPKLAQKPAPIIREPERRPIADPRPLLPLIGRPVKIDLRNGIQLVLPLKAVGPFDVLVGDERGALFVPLHAMLSIAAH